MCIVAYMVGSSVSLLCREMSMVCVDAVAPGVPLLFHKSQPLQAPSRDVISDAEQSEDTRQSGGSAHRLSSV